MSNSKKKLVFVTFFILIVACFNTVFATNRSSSNGMISNYIRDINVYKNQTNGVLFSYYSLMSVEDMLLCEGILKKNIEGYTKEAWDEMVEVLSRYTSLPHNVAYYILIEPNTEPYALFYINPDLSLSNVTEGTIFGQPVTEQDFSNCLKIWNYFITVYNYNELMQFDVISFTKRQDLDNGVNISPIGDDFNKWMMDVSINLLNDKDKLFKNVLNSLVFYHALRKDNLVEGNNSSSTNYTAYGRKYKQNSAINQFYKRFWKKIRLEYDQSQIIDYSKDYINQKASRSCHDDFVESFFNYVMNGVISENYSNSIVSQKTNFFENYAEYKDLAKRLKPFFGTK